MIIPFGQLSKTSVLTANVVSLGSNKKVCLFPETKSKVRLTLSSDSRFLVSDNDASTCDEKAKEDDVDSAPECFSEFVKTVVAGLCSNVSAFGSSEVLVTELIVT